MFNNITKIGFQNGVYLNLVANILKTLYNKSIIQGIRDTYKSGLHGKDIT